MIELALEYCLQARNDEALAWINLIDSEKVFLSLSWPESSFFVEGLRGIEFTAMVMTELRKEKCDG